MGILIAILEVVAGIVGIVLLLALFVKKGYSLEREIIVQRPVKEVFDYLKHIKNQDHYSKWVMTDPGMKKTYRGVDGTVGFVYAWDGNKAAGAGEQEIMNIVEEKQLDIEVRFIRPFAAVAKTPFSTTPIAANQTKVTWGMTSAMKYPMNFMLLFMNMDKMLGKDMDTSLGNLKRILEKE